MAKDKQPAQNYEGTIDLLQDTSVGGSSLCHVISPEIYRERFDGKNLPSSSQHGGKTGNYQRPGDVQIRPTVVNDSGSSSLTSTMNYCHRCCKSQQIYDQRRIDMTLLDFKVPLNLKNFTTCSIPCLFHESHDFIQSVERSANFSTKSSISSHRVRSPSIKTKKNSTNNESNLTNDESNLDLPRRFFKHPAQSIREANIETANQRRDSLYKIHFNTPPLPPLLNVNKRCVRKPQPQKSWKRTVFSCHRSDIDDSADSLAGSFKPGSNAPLETSEDDLLTVSGEGHKSTKEARRSLMLSERYVGCVRMKTCSRMAAVVLLMFLILLTVVGLLPSLVFWVLSTQQDKYPLPNEADIPLHSDEEQGIDDVTSSPPLARGSTRMELPLIDGWANRRHSKYKTIDKPMSFYNAQEFCQKLGGHLVHINSLREQVFVEDYIMQLLRLQNLTTWEDGIGFWIGARRDRGSHEGTCMFDQWKWVDPYGRTLGVVSGFAAFIPGKPDNYYRPEECLFLSYKDRMDETKFLKWDDAPCDLNSVGGIRALCEVEIR